MKVYLCIIDHSTDLFLKLNQILTMDQSFGICALFYLLKLWIKEGKAIIVTSILSLFNVVTLIHRPSDYLDELIGQFDYLK